MAIRSRYTNPARPARPAAEHRRTSKPSNSSSNGVAAKAKNAIKRFTQYVDKNQRDYVRETGDTRTLSDDLSNIPIHVIRESGKLGREEQLKIQSRNRRDSDEEIVRFMSGRGSSKQQCQQQASPKQHLEFEVKPKPKKRPAPRKVIYMDYDPEGEVE